MGSGEFKIFDNDDFLSLPKDEDEIVFNDFRILNIDYLIIGILLTNLQILKLNTRFMILEKDPK
ncbi:MAG: hypothetical protein CM15mP126_2470 [Gammaproteobacteria bacterium]|nr:MAG: hypothetical protein CM15mP126_2470 [Gammaproteobacteria bacterium]